MNAADFGNGAACGKQITITYQGKTTTATVRDKVSSVLHSRCSSIRIYQLSAPVADRTVLI